MRVYCDFDGTITVLDTTDQVLSQRADPLWQEVEAAWTAGKITAAECMRQQISLIDTDEAALDAVLDQCALRPGFLDFVAWCDDHNVPLTIVSDGVDRFITRILNRYNLGHLPVISNQLALEGEHFRLAQPHARPGCAAGSGVCKCAIVSEAQDEGLLVYIGDGRSDFCVSGRADILFARDRLADYASERKQAFTPFDGFDEIRAVLAGIDAQRHIA